MSTWRAQREQEGLSGLESKRPGPKPTKDAKDREIERLQRQLAKLDKEKRILEGLVDLQIKAHEILEIALPRVEDPEMDALQRRSVSARKGSR